MAVRPGNEAEGAANDDASVRSPNQHSNNAIRVRPIAGVQSSIWIKPCQALIRFSIHLQEISADQQSGVRFLHRAVTSAAWACSNREGAIHSAGLRLRAQGETQEKKGPRQRARHPG